MANFTKAQLGIEARPRMFSGISLMRQQYERHCFGYGVQDLEGDSPVQDEFSSLPQTGAA